MVWGEKEVWHSPLLEAVVCKGCGLVVGAKVADQNKLQWEKGLVARAPLEKNSHFFIGVINVCVGKENIKNMVTLTTYALSRCIVLSNFLYFSWGRGRD